MTTKITEKNISELANAGVNWQAVFTGDGSTGLTAVAGRGYFINTTSGTVEVTLPASPSAGDVVVLKDYARTWGTNAVSIASALFDGESQTLSFSTEGQTVTLVYMDGTKGWSLINEDTTSDLAATYISATGGTVTTSGNYKAHIFTGDGCFVVSQLGCGIPCAQASTVDYLVVAGGGGGGFDTGGGGAAGGFRMSNATCMPVGTTSPLANSTGITVSTTTYPITVGSGGVGMTSAPPVTGGTGGVSTFSTITSAGGGGGGKCASGGANGGSGGGGGRNNGGAGSGNTPPVSPPQGNNGGAGDPGGNAGGGGGGGAGAAGAIGNADGTNPTGLGGAGSYVANSFVGPTAPSYGESGPVGCTMYFAGGGGGGIRCICANNTVNNTGGVGGGGDGSKPGRVGGTAGVANTGGGGGGGGGPGPSSNGGSGIVILRYKFQ